MWLSLLSGLVGILHERLSLANKRAELATTTEEKKKAIDDGLRVADGFQRLIEKVKGLVHELRDDPPVPSAVAK